MYNNPYFNGFREPNTQQPIQNIINTQMPTQEYFMARFVNENETPELNVVNNTTAFINLHKKELTIKDVHGDIRKYGLILPKDAKDEKIESLEQQIKELKEMMLNEQSNDVSNVSTSNEITEPNSNTKKSNRK